MAWPTRGTGRLAALWGGIVLAAAFAVVFLAAGCEEKVKPPVAPTGLRGDIPSQESWNASIRFTDSGRTSAVLRAEIGRAHV